MITGHIIHPRSVGINAAQVLVCAGSSVTVVVFDATGTPTTTIKEGPLVTNGSSSVTGVITAIGKYESVSSDGRDTDKMSIAPKGADD
jgi:hypothetical protein